MVGIFKANNPTNTFLLFIYGLLLKLPWFLSPYTPAPQKSDGFLFIEILTKLKFAGEHFHIIYPLITYLLLFTQAVTFNKLINNQRLMQRSNYLPAMSYLLITSMFGEWNMLSAPLLINTLLIWVWSNMNNLYKSNNPRTVLYNIGLVIGLSGFLYLPSLVFAVLIVFALIVTRPVIITEWIVALVGVLTPYYFLFSYLFLSGRLKGYKVPGITVRNPVFHQSYWSFAAVLIILTAFVTGCYFLRINFKKQLVQVRKNWSIILSYLIVAAFVPFINATHTYQYWILCAVPLSAVIGCAFFYPEKKLIPLSLHWLMVACVLIIGYIQ